jgi:hypothetical protein
MPNVKLASSRKRTAGTEPAGRMPARYAMHARSLWIRARSKRHSVATRRRGSDCLTTNGSPSAGDTLSTTFEMPPPSSSISTGSAPITPRSRR